MFIDISNVWSIIKGGPGSGHYGHSSSSREGTEGGGSDLGGEGSGKNVLSETKVVEGKLVTTNEKDLPGHIQKIRIPPAWTGVVFNPDPEGDLLVKGFDSKRRLQAIYSERYMTRQAKAKFARVMNLNKNLGKVKKEISLDLKNKNFKIAELATCTRLIMETGIRAGSGMETGGDVKAYGASILEGRHIIKEGSNVRLKFVGKKGVSQDILVSNTDVVLDLLNRKKIAGNKNMIFDVGYMELLNYVKNKGRGGFLIKDLRTLNGTTEAVKAMENVEKPKTMKQYKKAVRTVAKVVAEKLGNTPTIALQSYINPSIFTAWRGKF